MEISCKTLNCIRHGLDNLYIHKQAVPREDHKCLSVVSAGRELCSVGLQHSQTQLEDDFDSVEEETVDHADSTLERQDAEEEGEEPREGDGREGGEVCDVFSQFWQTLPDQLLKHRLVHLGSWRRKWGNPTGMRKSVS